jgi:PAB-dependent poly(A)-specific ribonuclease subunit 2
LLSDLLWMLTNIVVSLADPIAQPESKWHLFNDFSVRGVSAAEALAFNANWKTPATMLYHLKAANNHSDDSWKSKIDTSVLFADTKYVHCVASTSPCSRHRTNIWGSSRAAERSYRLLDPVVETPGADTIIGLDTEFVSLQGPEIEMNAEGQQETIRPLQYGLARVSVVRGAGEDEGLAFIDDYISIKEKVADYLTTYSGIMPEDLDPRVSKHNLVSLKVAYKKLWVLLNLGCRFLGHGLKQDFRVINIQVPRAQVIDTIELFFLQARLRKLSLAFLAWWLLKEDIQLETHDSIEDARTALKLYRKWEEYTNAGVLEQILQEIYSVGRDMNFKAPRREKDVVKRTDTPPVPVEGAPGPVTPVRRGAAAAQAALAGGPPAWVPGKASPLK